MKKINESESKSDFEEFCRRMRIKWHFRNELSKNVTEKKHIQAEASWKSRKGNPNLEMFLRQVEQDLFKTIETPTRYSDYQVMNGRL